MCKLVLSPPGDYCPAMTQAEPTPARTRDRETTERLILAAAREVLAEAGFQGLGVNAVARRAGCDKQLIYRYFGGLEGLIDAIGADLGGWLQASLGQAGARTVHSHYGALVEDWAVSLMRALRANPLVQKIVAWEIADPSPQVRRLAEARSRGMIAWVARARGDLLPPEGMDAPAANALLIGAVQHLVLSAAAVGQFGGVPLASEADWARMEASLRALVQAVYPPPAPGSASGRAS